MKGETSGNYLLVSNDPGAIRTDCDRDALLVLVDPIGPTCHNGLTSCFGNDGMTRVSRLAPLLKLEDLIRRRKEEMPAGSYTTRLFEGGITKIAKKVGEEAVEVAIAAVAENRTRVVSESADLLYHLQVLWRETGVEIADVANELARRNLAKSPDLTSRSTGPEFP
jgi:phosphoribosyl-ATP pyrophosphohydrolase/phosphoribosyl-AMP cyclohydrolase